MGRPRLDPRQKKEQDSYRLKRWEHDWLIEDAGTDKPKAQHVADILRRYIKRKILRQRRQQKS